MKFRTIATFAALSLVTAPFAPALAKSADNEVTLHIEASAQVPPDRAVVPVVLTGVGKDEAAARANLASNEAELVADLEKQGIARSKVKDAPPLEGREAVVMEASTACAPAAAAVPAPRKGKSARAVPVTVTSIDAACPQSEDVIVSKTLLVELDEPAKQSAVQAMGANDGYGYGRTRPVFTQTDPFAARKKARSEALAKARAEADGYAEAMGYRVVRIERVSNARPAMNLNDLIAFIATIDDRANRMQPSWFAATITESVAIDFVIAPK